MALRLLHILNYAHQCLEITLGIKVLEKHMFPHLKDFLIF